MCACEHLPLHNSHHQRDGRDIHAHLAVGPMGWGDERFGLGLVIDKKMDPI